MAINSERIFEIDNIGLNETQLKIDGENAEEGYLSVDPWELVTNAIENLGLEPKLEEKYIEMIQAIKTQIEEEDLASS
jgi:hypothetical protein